MLFELDDELVTYIRKCTLEDDDAISCGRVHRALDTPLDDDVVVVADGRRLSGYWHQGVFYPED